MMEFVLSRTSSGDVNVDDKKYKVTKTQEYDEWLEEYIDKYFIEINSLEELMEFQKGYGKIIIMDNRYGGEMKEIEIYDDYRE